MNQVVKRRSKIYEKKELETRRFTGLVLQNLAFCAAYRNSSSDSWESLGSWDCWFAESISFSIRKAWTRQKAIKPRGLSSTRLSFSCFVVLVLLNKNK